LHERHSAGINFRNSAWFQLVQETEERELLPKKIINFLSKTESKRGSVLAQIVDYISDFLGNEKISFTYLHNITPLLSFS